MYFIVLRSKQRLYSDASSAARRRRGLPASAYGSQVQYSNLYGFGVSNEIGLLIILPVIPILIYFKNYKIYFLV